MSLPRVGPLATTRIRIFQKVLPRRCLWLSATTIQNWLHPNHAHTPRKDYSPESPPPHLHARITNRASLNGCAGPAGSICQDDRSFCDNRAAFPTVFARYEYWSRRQVRGPARSALAGGRIPAACATQRPWRTAIWHAVAGDTPGRDARAAGPTPEMNATSARPAVRSLHDAMQDRSAARITTTSLTSRSRIRLRFVCRETRR